jgi:hypothetical protein
MPTWNPFMAWMAVCALAGLSKLTNPAGSGWSVAVGAAVHRLWGATHVVGTRGQPWLCAATCGLDCSWGPRAHSLHNLPQLPISHGGQVRL